MKKLNSEGSHVFYRFLSILVSCALLTSLTSPREVRAQDAQTLGMLAGGLGGLAILFSGVDSMESAKNCACQATGCKALVPWQDCAMLGVGIAGVAAGVVTMMSGASESGAVRGTGSPDYNRTFDPTQPLAPQICQGENASSPACDCSGPKASVNILCGPDSIKNVKKTLDDSRQKFADGLLTLPEGMSPDDFNAQNSKAVAMLDDLLAGNLGAIDSSSLGEATGNGKSGGLGKVGSDIIGGGDSDALGLLGKTKAGPADRAGLGKISFANALDSIDEATGKFLTLWQRNTRRHQGDLRGSRAFFFAKVEFMRKRVVAPSTLASAERNQPQGSTRTLGAQEKKAPAPTRQPASVPQRMRIKQ